MTARQAPVGSTATSDLQHGTIIPRGGVLMACVRPCLVNACVGYGSDSLIAGMWALKRVVAEPGVRPVSLSCHQP